jgi:hypothetical protein
MGIVGLVHLVTARDPYPARFGARCDAIPTTIAQTTSTSAFLEHPRRSGNAVGSNEQSSPVRDRFPVNERNGPTSRAIQSQDEHTGAFLPNSVALLIRRKPFHGPWRQVELFEPTEAQGRSHREGLRAARRLQEDRRETCLGDRQQAGRRRGRQEKKHREEGRIEEGRTEICREKQQENFEEGRKEENRQKVIAPEVGAHASLRPAMPNDRTLAALEEFRADIERLSRDYPDDRDFWPAYAEQANQLEANTAPALRDYVRESISRTILSVRSTRSC